MGTVIGGRECTFGIDVSRWQGTPDWLTIRQVRDFAWIKAGGADGGLYQDNQWQRNRAEATRVGMPSGAYFFISPAFSGATQADYFASLLGNYDMALPPALDVEMSGTPRQTVIDFANRIEDRVGRRWIGPTGQPVGCIIYSGMSMTGSLSGPLAKYDLWDAAYMSWTYPQPGPSWTQVRLPPVPGPWSTWSVWQGFGEDGRCPGVSGACDQNAGTLEWFNRTLRGKKPTGDWLDMATKEEVQAMIDGVGLAVLATASKVDALGQRLDHLSEQVHSDSFNSRPVWFFQFPEKPGTDWVAWWGPSGPVRAEVPDGYTYHGLLDIGMVAPEGNLGDPYTTIVLSDPNKIAAIKRFPVVPWPAG